MYLYVPTNSNTIQGQTSEYFEKVRESSSTSLKFREVSFKFRELRPVSCNFAKFSRISRSSLQKKKFVNEKSPKRQFSPEGRQHFQARKLLYLYIIIVQQTQTLRHSPAKRDDKKESKCRSGRVLYTRKG